MEKSPSILPAERSQTGKTMLPESMYMKFHTKATVTESRSWLPVPRTEGEGTYKGERGGSWDSAGSSQ